MRKKRDIRDYIILILFIILIISLAVIIYILNTPEKKAKKIKQDYVMPKVEQNAEKYSNEDETETKLPQESGGGAVSLNYSKDVNVFLSQDKLECFFANPEKSNQNIMVNYMIGDITIAQSGIIEPGYQIRTLPVMNKNMISTGTYEGKTVVSYYQADSGEKAMVDTEVAISIVIQD